MNVLKDEYTFLEKGVIDEMVISNAMVHLECLDDHSYMLIVENEKHHWHFNIFNPSHRAKVVCKLYEDVPTKSLEVEK